MADPILSTDPLDALLDDDGDIAFDENFEVPFAMGVEGIAQLISIAIKLYLGEWFADLDEGTPWLQELLAQIYDETTWRSRLSQRIIGVPGVNVIVSLVLAYDNQARAVSVSYVAMSTFGDTVADTLVQKVGK